MTSSQTSGRAVESEEQIRWWPRGHVCLMAVSACTGNAEPRFRAGVYPFGCLAQGAGTFVRVKLWVDSRLASPVGNPDGPKQQAWPCHVRLGVQLVTGKQSSNFANLDIEEHEAVYFHMRAKSSDESDGLKTTISDLKALDPIIEGDDVKDDTLRIHLKSSNAMEKAYIIRMIEEKSLYEIEIMTPPRNLAPSNLFIKESGHKTFQELADTARGLHHHPDITFLKFRLIFCAPDAGKTRDDWVASMGRSIHNFRTAQKMENKTRGWPGEMYVISHGKGFMTHKNLYKDVSEMPNFTPPHFDIAPSIQDMILMHGLDLHHLYEQKRAELKDLEKGVFEARFLQLKNGQNQTFGCFLNIGEEQPGISAFTKGLTGSLILPDYEDASKPSFVVSQLPSMSDAKHSFLVIRFDQATNNLPCKVIDLKTSTAEKDLADSISASEFTHVKLHAKYTNATETQHWKALQASNPEMNQTGEPAEIAKYVCRILAGHGLGEIEMKSVWTVDVLACIKSNIEMLDERFAEAINKPGARLSMDQLKAIAYFADAPDDLLLIIDGSARTGKSSTMALLTCLLQMFGQTARVLVSAKMHKTVNTTAEAMIPIIECFHKDKRVVRDWGDKSDLYLLIWLLKGRPRYFDAFWTIRGSAEEQADLKNLIDRVEETMDITLGTSSKAPVSAVHRTVVWQMFEELKDLKLMDLLNEGTQLAKEEENRGGSVNSRKVMIEWIDESEQALASMEPEVSPDDWKFKLHQLLRRIVEKLDQPWKKADEREVLPLLREIKLQWSKKFCGVWCTTISRLDSQEVKDYAATHVFMEEAQSVDDHDMKLVLTQFAKVWKILIGDSKRPGPYVKKDSKFNRFSVVRRESILQREVRRGRHYVELTEG